MSRGEIGRLLARKFFAAVACRQALLQWTFTQGAGHGCWDVVGSPAPVEWSARSVSRHKSEKSVVGALLVKNIHYHLISSATTAQFIETPDTSGCIPRTITNADND